MCKQEAHVHRKSPGPFAGWPVHLYGTCTMRPCPETYGPIATWSDCSVFMPEQAHINGRLETAHNNIIIIITTIVIIRYLYGAMSLAIQRRYIHHAGKSNAV